MIEHIPIPIELLEQFERGNVLLFVGEGINRGVLPSSAELSEELAVRCDYPPEEPLTLPRVAGYYELTRDRHGLIQFLRDQLDNPALAPLRAHKLVAQLRPCVIVTTCYDRLLERALQEAGIPYIPVVGNAEVAYAEEQKVLLVWLWGVLDQPDSVVVTEDDRRLFLEGRANLSDVLRSELARRTWLFVGFDAEDEWFRGFYDSVNRVLDRQSRRAYIFGATLGAYTRAWWEKRNAEILSAEVEAFLTALTDQLAARARPELSIPCPVPAPAEPLPLPEEPYKALVSYEAKDRALFFGREREIEELTRRIHAHRLVLLYGASGVGKTSLLQAGAIPRLEEAKPGYTVVSVRALTDPVTAIRAALRRQLPDVELPTDDAPLVDFLAAATRIDGRPLVLVIDQFEEFFIRLSSELRAEFIAELGNLYDARDLPVKVVLSLREDYLANVSELENRIPEVLRTGMRLMPLTREQACDAIVCPAEALGYAYEPALVERLLDDLTREGVLPPQLQLVCSALCQHTRAKKRTVISMADYEALAGAQGVLRNYLDEELMRFHGEERSLARDVLEELVSSEGTRKVGTLAELTLALQADEAMMGSALEKLVRAHLLRAVQPEEMGGKAYELTHEYLIKEITLSPEALARKQAEELLSQAVDNWRRFGALPSADTFALITGQRHQVRLSAEAEELMLQSALRYGQDVGYWLNRMRNSQQAATHVATALVSEDARLRAQALSSFRDTVVDIDEVHESVLVDLLLKAFDTKSEVRRCAAEALWYAREQLPVRTRLKVTSTVLRQRAQVIARRSALPAAATVALILLVALGAAAIGQMGVFAPRWVPTNGPYGGAANCIAVHPQRPDTIYVGTIGRGVFESEDGGQTWRARSVGLTNLVINNIAIDPFNPEVLYCSTKAGLFRSRDRGKNWTDISGGLLISHTTAVAFDHNQPDLVYVGTWGAGVYKSEDAGEHWISSNNGLTNLAVHILIDPLRPNQMYVATPQGAFGSEDAGQTWQYLGPEQADVKLVELDPTNTDVLYAGVWDQGVFSSDDRGQTWVLASEGLTDKRVRSFAIVSGTGEIYIGAWGGDLFRSRDGARHWTPITGGMGVARSVRSDPRDPSVLFLATNNGFFKSTDGGQTWSQSVIHELAVRTLAGVGREPTTMFAGTEHGVFILGSDGQWLSANTGLRAINVRSIFASEVSGEIVYAIVGEGDLYRSDGARTWAPFGPRLPSASTLAIDPADLNHILVADSTGQLHLTSDGGNTWSQVWNTPSPSRCAVFDGQDSPAIYVGTDNHGVFKSTDYGATWTPINTGLGDSTVVALAVDLTSPNAIYAATGIGVSKTTDGGAGWHTLGGDVFSADVYSIVLDASGQAVWVATGHGIFRSDDGGVSWRLLDRGLPASQPYVLSVRQGESPYMYVGTQEGVYRLVRWWDALSDPD